MKDEVRDETSSTPDPSVVGTLLKVQGSRTTPSVGVRMVQK